MASSRFEQSRKKAIEEFRTEINAICRKECISFDVKIKELRDRYCRETQKEDFLKKTKLGVNQILHYEDYHRSKAEKCIRIALEYGVDNMKDIDVLLNAGGCAALYQCDSKEYIVLRTALKYIILLKSEYRERMSISKTVGLFDEMIEIGGKGNAGSKKTETIGKRIKMCRKLMGLSGEELGAKIGKGKTSISNYENGVTKEIGLGTLLDMAAILGTTPWYFVDGKIDYLDEDTMQLVTLFESINDKNKRAVAIKMVEQIIKFP